MEYQGVIEQLTKDIKGLSRSYQGCIKEYKAVIRSQGVLGEYENGIKE